jgi:hypothetical protein
MIIIKKTTTNADKDFDIKEPSYTVGGNVNISSTTMEINMKAPNTTKIELPYDSATSLLGVFLKERKAI